MFFGVFGVFFGVFGVFWRIWCFFWRIWCFALRTCFLFGVLGVWFGVFGILSSLKMCRFLLINFAESSLYCVFCGKRYTGWKKVHHRRWCGGGLISGMVTCCAMVTCCGMSSQVVIVRDHSMTA